MSNIGQLSVNVELKNVERFKGKLEQITAKLVEVEILFEELNAIQLEVVVGKGEIK